MTHVRTYDKGNPIRIQTMKLTRSYIINRQKRLAEHIIAWSSRLSIYRKKNYSFEQTIDLKNTRHQVYAR